MTTTLLALGTLLSLTSATALATTPSVIIGVTGGTSWGEPDSLKFRENGFASERLNANPGHTTIAESIALGWKNDLVIVGNTNDEEELSKVNISKWTEETLAQVKEQAAHGVTLMEVGNEMFLKGPRCGECYQQKEPARYAEMFVSLSKAVEEAGITGVKLLSTATATTWKAKAANGHRSAAAAVGSRRPRKPSRNCSNASPASPCTLTGKSVKTKKTTGVRWRSKSSTNRPCRSASNTPTTTPPSSA
jgi:hypothetical protein